MIHDKFYAKYTVLKNTDPLHNDHIVRVSFYDDKTKVGQAYVSGFDTNTPYLFNFKIYKKYQGNKYGSDAMEYMIDRLGINTLNVQVSNYKAVTLYTKYKFIISTTTVDPEDGKLYYFMQYCSK